MKRLLPFVLLVILLPSVSATCLTLDEISTISLIENEANISNNTLLNLFEDMCQRIVDTNKNMTIYISNTTDNFYTKNESDSLINIWGAQIESNYSSSFDEFIESYEELYETTTILSEIVKLMNASQNLDKIEVMIDQKNQLVKDEVDVILQGFRDDYVKESELKNLVNLTAFSPGPTTYTMVSDTAIGYILLAIVVIVFVFFGLKKYIAAAKYPAGMTERFQ